MKAGRNLQSWRRRRRCGNHQRSLGSSCRWGRSSWSWWRARSPEAYHPVWTNRRQGRTAWWTGRSPSLRWRDASCCSSWAACETLQATRWSFKTTTITRPTTGSSSRWRGSSSKQLCCRWLKELTDVSVLTSDNESAGCVQCALTDLSCTQERVFDSHLASGQTRAEWWILPVAEKHWDESGQHVHCKWRWVT